VRPHDIDIQREAGDGTAFSATVANIHPIGSIVRLELQRSEGGSIVEAELSRERHRELALKQGEQVWIKPRSVRIFLDQQPVA
jgi:sulfate transport system ATP-binding protein